MSQKVNYSKNKDRIAAKDSVANQVEDSVLASQISVPTPFQSYESISNDIANVRKQINVREGKERNSKIKQSLETILNELRKLNGLEEGVSYQDIEKIHSEFMDIEGSLLYTMPKSIQNLRGQLIKLLNPETKKANEMIGQQNIEHYFNQHVLSIWGDTKEQDVLDFLEGKKNFVYNVLLKESPSSFISKLDLLFRKYKISQDISPLHKQFKEYIYESARYLEGLRNKDWRLQKDRKVHTHILITVESRVTEFSKYLEDPSLLPPTRSLLENIIEDIKAIYEEAKNRTFEEKKPLPLRELISRVEIEKIPLKEKRNRVIEVLANLELALDVKLVLQEYFRAN
jgi:hypothetical protein